MAEIDVIFAHHDALNIAISDYPCDLNRRQLKRWKSRQLANRLLKMLFKKHQLDETLLNQIERTASGRPYLPNCKVDFNISHSGDWVAIIFCRPKGNEKKRVVGIDLEHPQKIHRFEALIRRYANAVEIEQLIEKPELPFLPDLAQRFYLSWCLREAVLKSQGVGIVKLSEVAHFPKEKRITTQYSPKGRLDFYYQLPFFLAYFFEGDEKSNIDLYQWKGENLQKIEQIQPLVYQVN